MRKLLGLLKRMLHFTTKPHPLTGEIEWVAMSDYKRDIARSGYADMLNDRDRNERYHKAITAAVLKMKESGRTARVLDIGTGTGLLSMMASRAGADEIYACECFEPMYQTAKRITLKNGIKNIKIIPKRSTELKIPLDIPKKCNILITETFDTELIGEHCLQTYNHAVANLMEDNFLAIPTSASVFIQLSVSPTIQLFNTLRDHPSTNNCPGLNSVQDLQLSKFQPGIDFFQATDPIQVFHLDFTKLNEEQQTKVIKSDEKYNAAFLFWKLDMEGDGKNIISCFPSYLDPSYEWREHWMQCAYYIQEQIRASELKIRMDSLFYYFGDKEPTCECGFHRKISRSRMYQLNTLNYSFFQSLPHFEEILFISDNSLVPKYLKCDKLQILGENEFSLKSDQVSSSVKVIVAEPSFLNSQNSMHNLYFYKIAKERQSTALIYPQEASVNLLFVKFTHLHKIRSKVGSTCNFNLQLFDELITKSEELEVESHPLWEYDFQIVSNLESIFKVDVNTCQEILELDVPPSANGAIFHPTFHFGQDTLLTDFCKNLKTFRKGSYQSVLFLDEKISSKLAVKFDLVSGLQATNNHI